MILDILREAIKITKEKRRIAKEAAERANVARVFNDLFTYRIRWDTSTDERIEKGTAMWDIFPKKGFAWMCPECNKVHLADECSVMSGLQFPGCCSTGAGHRLYHDIRQK